MPLLLFLFLCVPNTGVTITVYAEQYLVCPFLNLAHVILERDLAIPDYLISSCVSSAIIIYSSAVQEYPSLYHILSYRLFLKYQAPDYVSFVYHYTNTHTPRGAQIPGARSPWQLILCGWPFNMNSQIQSQGSACSICGGQSGAVTCCFQFYLPVIPLMFHALPPSTAYADLRLQFQQTLPNSS
jgi:hypothetical protein